MSRFGTWTSPRNVEESIRDFLAAWIEEFIAEAERQFGIDPRSIPVPGLGQFVLRRDDFEKWPEEQMPVVLIQSPGAVAELRREADRSLTAPIAFQLAVLTSSGGHPDNAAQESAQIIGTALKQLLDNLPIDGLKTDGLPLLMDEQYDGIPFAKQRDLGSVRLIYRIWVRNWVVKGRPPKPEPRPDPYGDPGDYPTVREDGIGITLDNRRIGQ